MDNQWIIVAGSMGGGFFFHGPFDSPEEAQEHAASNGFGVWEVSPLHAPHEADCPAVDGIGCRCGENQSTQRTTREQISHIFTDDDI